MPSPRYFQTCPTFPSDAEVAELPTLSLPKLERRDEEEITRLFHASREYGFYALDLQSSEQGITLVQDAEKMFDLASETLNLDKSTLDKYAYQPPKDLMGYKQAGMLKTDDGKLDTTEIYTLSQDEVLGNIPPRTQPQPIQDRQTECRDFFKRAYNAIAVVLNALDARLGLPAGTLAHLSAPTRESATSLRFPLARPHDIPTQNISLGGHTDIGLITLLFHIAGGLQILPANLDNKDQNWRHVRPRPNCALVNLGDTLVEWTGGVLRSSLHRVVTAPGPQAQVPRVSLAYLVRPARGETMRRLRGEGGVIPRGEDDENAQSVDEWAAEQATNIIRGIVKPRTKGGVSGSIS